MPITAITMDPAKPDPQTQKELERLRARHKEYTEAETRCREQAQQALNSAVANQGAAAAIAREIQELEGKKAAADQLQQTLKSQPKANPKKCRTRQPSSSS